MLSRFHLIPERNGNGNENISNAPPTVDRRRITQSMNVCLSELSKTDRQTDGRTDLLYQYRSSARQYANTRQYADAR